MSAEVDATTKITVEGEDNASAVIDDATKRINQSYRTMRQQQRQANREFEVNNRVLTQSARVLSSLGSVVSRTVAIYNTFQLHQLRLQENAEGLADAQRDVTEAFLEFGQGSPEHIEAMKRETAEMKRQEQLQQQAILNWILLGTTIATNIGTVISRVLPKVRTLQTTIAGITGKGATGAGTSLGSKIASGVSKIPKPALGVVGAGLFASELLGGQSASAPLADSQGNAIDDPNDISNESGIDAIVRTAGDIYNIVNNVFSPSSQETVDEIADNTIRSLPFGNK
jgi:hypothetical protein